MGLIGLVVASLAALIGSFLVITHLQEAKHRLAESECLQKFKTIPRNKKWNHLPRIALQRSGKEFDSFLGCLNGAVEMLPSLGGPVASDKEKRNIGPGQYAPLPDK